MADSIADIHKNFDYEKVHRVMTSLNWIWALIPGVGIPSIEELRQEADRMLWSCYNGAIEHHVDNWSIMTGGLYVRFYRTASKPYISLAFQVAHWDNEW